MRHEPSPEADRLAHAVIGAAIEVHRVLGPGFLESVCEESLCIELGLRQIPFTRQAPIGVDYKGYSVGGTRLNFLIGGLVVVELKAVECSAPIHTAQVSSCLKAAHLELGLLIIFNVTVLKDGLKRKVLS